MTWLQFPGRPCLQSFFLGHGILMFLPLFAWRSESFQDPGGPAPVGVLV